MALQLFPLESAQKVCQHIRHQLVLPPTEQQPVLAGKQETETIYDMPEPSSLDALGDLFRVGGFDEENLPAPNAEGRWFISTIDPAAALQKLPGLALKPRVRLITFLQRRPEGGIGVTWALPELMSTTEHLETVLITAGMDQIPPRPKGALSHVMDGVTGNGSVTSFLAASLLIREWKELGRSGSLGRWSYHQLVGAVPSHQAWQWRSKVPQDFSPKVKVLADHSVLVEFFSCRTVAPIALFRHLDQYKSGSYHPNSHDQVIALAQTSHVPQP